MKIRKSCSLAMETDVDRHNVRWSVGNFSNSPGIWPSRMPGEGGLRVCGGTVLLDFWCGFAVLRLYKTKRFAVFRSFRVNSKAVCGFRMLICVVSIFLRYSYLAYVPLPGERSIWRLPGWREVFDLEMWVRWSWGVYRLKKWLFRPTSCSARTSKVKHYIRTAFLKVWCIWCIRIIFL